MLRVHQSVAVAQQCCAVASWAIFDHARPMADVKRNFPRGWMYYRLTYKLAAIRWAQRNGVTDMTLDYEFTTVRRYDGSGRMTKAIEVFDCTTGQTVSIVRCVPFESRAAWIARAMARGAEDAARAA